MTTRSTDTTRPAFDVKVNDQALPLEVALQVSGIDVDEDAGLPSMFSVSLAGRDGSDLTAGIDGDLFAVGAAVEIRMGYGDALQGLIAAEVTALEPAFTRGGRPSLTVRGYDRRHRLLRGRKTRSFVQQKDSDIAAAIAKDAGLRAQTQDSQVVHDYVLQADQTDLEFLDGRARRIQYEVVVTGGTLHFRPVQNDQGAALTLTLQDDLLEFYPRLSTLGQYSQVELRGWSPQDREEIVGRAGSGAEVSRMGGSNSGAALADRAFGSTSLLIGDQPVLNQAEADQLARACYNRALLRLITGDGRCRGRTDLHPGQVIRIDGIGTRFSGLYYVKAASHRYAPDQAYLTHFVVARNAV